MMSLPSPSRSLIRQKTEPIKDDSDSRSSMAMTWDKVRLMVCSVLVRRTEAERKGWVEMAALEEVIVDVDMIILPGALPLCCPGFLLVTVTSLVPFDCTRAFDVRTRAVLSWSFFYFVPILYPIYNNLSTFIFK